MKNLKSVKDPDIAMILQMPCLFADYDVSYEDEAMVKKFQKLAAKYGVKTTTKSYEQVMEPDYPSETCEGTVEGCLRYLQGYIEADYGYQAGLALEFKKIPKDPEWSHAFTKFVDWISASHRFEDFKEGIKENDNVSRYYIAD